MYTFSSMQALEAMVRLENNNHLSYEIANGYLVEDFKVDKGTYRTVVTISLAPQAILKRKEELRGKDG